MDLFAGFHDISVWQLIPVAAVALFASVVGGVSGYGTGALMPLVLVPLVGAEPVVPIIAISAMFTNSSRVFAFLKYVDWRRTAIVLALAVPTCVLGAWGSWISGDRTEPFRAGYRLVDVASALALLRGLVDEPMEG